MQFKAGSPEIEPHELVRYLLQEASQLTGTPSTQRTCWTS